MSDFFKTVKGISQGLYKEKMSKFISFAEPVQSADEAKAVIKKYQNQYHDARHVCWAYMIGTERNEYLSSDNGEPSGTAGKPILGQINSFELTNIVIVVVRYFGGIKLGTSGLIVAYREAAAELCRVIARREPLALTAHLTALENRRFKREQLLPMVEGAWQISADALLSRCGKPGACGEAADILRRAFDRRQLQKLTDLFRRYCDECQYNVGVGHVLGALGAELAQTLAL